MKPHYTCQAFSRIQAVIAVSTLLTLFACEELEHANPADPAFTLQAPTLLTVDAVSDTEIRLTWTDNTGYESGFKIERDSGSGFEEIGTVAENITEYTDAGLTFGQSYSYRVAADQVDQ
ncbi:MAG: fibronectin type III domain-containing protein [Candidatus Marinimicrobia bacterium]|nr:fibronectin type III domain-containing protein [Candidatus Neomarinimicrobiota bacterium]